MPPTETNQKPSAVDRSARRREKSRDAARCRRQQESDTFAEICKCIPVPEKLLAQMDRSMVMRLLISFMKLRGIINSNPMLSSGKLEEDKLDVVHDSEYVDALNGFIMVLSHDCDILFVSANVKQYIGINSLDLMGQNLFCYTHEGDHLEVSNCIKESSGDRTMRSFFMRMKSTLTSTGKNVNLKSALFKVLKCDGVVHQSPENNKHFMVTYCEPIPHPANIETVMDCSTFLSQHSLDMKFTYCDDRVSKLLIYSEDDMVGHSFYDLCHTDDIKSIEESFKKLFRLGQITTDQYRMLVKSGGYAWVITQATVINNPRNQQPSYVVCVHSVVSGVLAKDCILSLSQLKYQRENELVIPKLEEIAENPLEPVDCTEAIFDNTESIFCETADSECAGPSDATNNIFGAANDIFTPSIESLEAMAKNAPSIGDEIEFENLHFIDSFLDNEDMCRNAPCIGDPAWDIQAAVMSPKGNVNKFQPTVNVDRDKAFLKNGIVNSSSMKAPIFQNSCIGFQPKITNSVSNSTLPGDTSSIVTVTATKRKLPRDSQIITIPKNQYHRHLKPVVVDPEDLANWGYIEPKKADLKGFHSPPNKKLKCQPGFNLTDQNEWKMREFQNIKSSPPLSVDGNTLSAATSPRYEYSVAGSPPAYDLDIGMNYDFKTGKMNMTPPSKDRDPSWLQIKNDTDSLLPILSLQDCEVNAPIEDKLQAADWFVLSSALNSVA